MRHHRMLICWRLLYLCVFLCFFCQLVETAPTGVISNRAFCDTIMDLTALTVSTSITAVLVCFIVFCCHMGLFSLVWRLRVLLFMPKILEISFGNQMEQFGPTGKFPEKKRTTFEGGRLWPIGPADPKFAAPFWQTRRVFALLLFNRFSLMPGIGERNRKW